MTKPSWFRRLWWMMCGYRNGAIYVTLRPGFWVTMVWAERGLGWRCLWEDWAPTGQTGSFEYYGRLW